MVFDGAKRSIVMAVLCVLTRLSAGAVNSAEDLTGCRLPNGLIILPAAGTPEASKGALLKLSVKALAASPASDDGKPLTPEQVIAKLRASKAADLQYLPEFSGLWAFSGRILELPGVSYLSDVSGKKLDPPLDILGTSKVPAGVYDNIQEGRVYFLETTDKHYALLRVLEKNKSMVALQYVYQPDGSATFEVPANPFVPYRSPTNPQATTAPADTGVAAMNPHAMNAPATHPSEAPSAPDPTRLASNPHPPTTLPAPPRQELGPEDYVAPGYIVTGPSQSGTPANASSTMNAFMQQRAQLIQRRVDIIRSLAVTTSDVDTKTQAIFDLANLHADETADLLVSQIAFLNTRSNVREFSAEALHPCVAALKRLGKPASAAAIKGLKQLDVNVGEGIDSDRYKADLLAMVIVSVETKDVAAFILRRELDAETDSRRRAVLEYVVGKVTAQQ